MAVEIKATPTAFDRGAPQALFDLRSIILPPNTGSTGYAPAPDGKRFLVATAPASPPTLRLSPWSSTGSLH